MLILVLVKGVTNVTIVKYCIYIHYTYICIRTSTWNTSSEEVTVYKSVYTRSKESGVSKFFSIIKKILCGHGFPWLGSVVEIVQCPGDRPIPIEIIFFTTFELKT